MECVEYRQHSPENPEFAWCGKYLVNLDREGRFCRRCKTDGIFRQMLRQQGMVRGGQECIGDGGYCEVFGLATNQQQCEKCNTDGAFRAFLRGQAQAAIAGRIDNCPQRGAIIRREKQKCCGGKIRELEIFVCGKKGVAHKGLCAVCGIIA